MTTLTSYICAIKANPTNPFPILELLNPSHDVTEEQQKKSSSHGFWGAKVGKGLVGIVSSRLINPTTHFTVLQF